VRCRGCFSGHDPDTSFCLRRAISSSRFGVSCVFLMNECSTEEPLAKVYSVNRIFL
jgi:hypothetical protein